MTSPVKMPPAWRYFLVRKIFILLGRIFLQQEVRGIDNLPAQGPFLLAFNHLSMVDPLLVLVHLSRQAVALAADKYERAPFLGWFCRLMGALWVTRGEADMDAIKTALGHLRSGGILVMAPEGTRSLTGQLLPGKTGAAYLATRTGVPILPVGIWGTEEVFANMRRLRRSSVGFVVGEPIHLPADSRAKGEKLDEYTDLIMRRIAALLPPEYRGVYANRV